VGLALGAAALAALTLGLPALAQEAPATAVAGPEAAPPAPPFDGNPELKARLDAPGRIAVAGERLHSDLLRRFYAARGYKTVWDIHPNQAAALRATLAHADRQGLDPALFQRPAVAERDAKLSPVERDLLQTDAFLAYADALARGAMPIEDRYDDEDLRPEPVDVAAVLDAAIKSPDPGKAIEALAPTSPEYRAMLRAYHEYKAIAAGTAAPVSDARRKGERAAAIDRATAEKRARLLQINLERLRWLPRQMPADRVVVNTAIAELRLYRDNQPIFTTRVIVGQVDKQTPEFRTTIDSVLFNPPWNVPRSIVEEEILPKLASDRHYLERHHMRWRGPNAVQQEAGPYSALGRLKFEMPDRFDVYLHDTPERWRFRAASRLMSHGCVRVENPQALASLVLGQSPEAIAKSIALGYTNRRMLPTSLPILIVYQTAYVESDGSIAFRGDPYGRDTEIWTRLTRSSSPPMAQDAGTVQRKG
jgi:murein L,D-transpeptidase YcbB/YkuD